MLHARCFYLDPEKIVGIVIYLSFSDDVFWPIIFYACVFAFSFCAFLQHCPIHHLPLKLRYASIFLQFVNGLINTTDALMSTPFFGMKQENLR